MSRLALITGASSGIGRALARHHAKKGGDVILVARREDALNSLKSDLESDFGIKAHVIAMDIAGPEAAMALHRRVTEDGHEIDYLINNAGFGGQGAHIERDLGAETAMIDLNVKSLVALCHAFGRDMAGRGEGRILNVGSTAGMMPGPNQAVYFATKAFVNSYSQALDEELRAKGVTVTVLAPGYVETEFADRADLNDTAMVKRGGASPESVAVIGYDAMQAGKLVAVNDPGLGMFLRFVQPILPRRALLKGIAKTQAKAA